MRARASTAEIAAPTSARTASLLSTAAVYPARLPAPPKPDASGGRQLWPAALLLAGLVAAVHGRSIGFDFTRTDDTVLIVDDAAFLTDPSNALAALGEPFFRRGARGEAYYRPLVTLSFMLDASWGGTDPAAFHATNVALHLVACLLAYLLLLRLAPGRQTRGLALAGAVVLAVHPALVEAVAWIPGRTDTLLTALGAGQLLALHRFADEGRARWLALSHAALVLGLLTKEAAVALPLVAAAYLWLVARRLDVLRDARTWLGWLLALAAWAAAYRAAVAGRDGESAVDRIAALVANADVVLMHLGKITLPVDLSVLATRQDTSWTLGLAGAALVGVAIASTRGRARRGAAFGAVTFLLLVAPGLPVSDYLILESRLYFPTLAVVVTACAAASGALERDPASARPLFVGWALLCAAFVALAVQHGQHFRDREAFTSAAVAGSPHSALAHLNRGIVHHLEGDLERAAEHYERARALDPRQPVVHNNLGLLALGAGDAEAAHALFVDEIAIDPGYDKAHFNLGLALGRLGRPEEAAEAFERAIELNPDNVDAMGELFAHHARRGERDRAERYRRAMEARGVEFFSP